jgi:hypothetical protein
LVGACQESPEKAAKNGGFELRDTRHGVRDVSSDFTLAVVLTRWRGDGDATHNAKRHRKCGAVINILRLLSG